MKLILSYIIPLFTLFFSYFQKDSPLLWIADSLDVARHKGDFHMLARLYYTKALNNMDISIRGDDVMDDLQQSATYFRYVKDSLGYCKSRMAIADLHIRNQSYYDDAISLLEESLLYFKRKSYKALEARAYTLLSKAYEEKQNYQEALDNITSALNLNTEVKDTLLEIENALTISNILALQGNVERAITIAEASLDQSRIIKSDYLQAESLFLLASYYLKISERTIAIPLLEEAVAFSYSGSKQKANIYNMLSNCYENENNISKALYYQKQYSILNENLMDNERMAITDRLSFEYQTREKEREIGRLEKEKEFNEIQLQQQRRLLFALILGLVAGLIAVFYIMRFYRQKIRVSNLLSRQKEQLNLQKITQLENNLKIKSLESMVTGQEVERKRIATDLHDSLGGTLSALKLQFETLPFKHDKLSKDSSYKHINIMIDGACEEVRKIARNLKPTSLEKIGLVAALRDLINRFKGKDKLDISFHCSNIDGLLDYDSKLHVYRIVQELINNAVKHSLAREIDVQITKQSGELLLKVEDDGVGFDINHVKHGLGLDNIQSRVNIVKGEWNIDSKVNGGTSVIVYIPIDKTRKSNGSSFPSKLI